jgi:hypothetical protein
MKVLVETKVSGLLSSSYSRVRDIDVRLKVLPNEYISPFPEAFDAEQILNPSGTLRISLRHQYLDFECVPPLGGILLFMPPCFSVAQKMFIFVGHARFSVLSAHTRWCAGGNDRGIGVQGWKSLYI